MAAEVEAARVAAAQEAARAAVAEETARRIAAEDAARAAAAHAEQQARLEASRHEADLAAARHEADLAAARHEAGLKAAQHEADLAAARHEAALAAIRHEADLARTAAALAAERAAAERAAAENAACSADASVGRAGMAPALSPAQALVMVADDSKVVRVKTSRLLAHQGYRVVLAEDGADAMRKIESEAPHVLITDVEMPVMDGFELTRFVRQNPRTAGILVIMITSADDRHSAQAAVSGVSVLLGKPYSEEQLLGHVATALAASSQPA